MTSNTCIVACGKYFDIGARVVLWHEQNGLNGYDRSRVVKKVENRKYLRMSCRLAYVKSRLYINTNRDQKLSLPIIVSKTCSRNNWM